MSDTYTTGLNLTKPEAGASRDTWGSKWNTNLDALDAAIARALDGQCRLVAASANVVKLMPFNGNGLVVNGVVQQIPAAGVTFNISGLSKPSTNFVYAYMTTGSNPTLAIEAVPTGYTFDNYGRANKTGDATRRLVGMIRVNSAGSITASAFQILSFFNRRAIVDNLAFSNISTSSTSRALITSQGFLSWAGEFPAIYFLGYAANNTSGKGCQTYMFYDGTGLGNTYNDTGQMSSGQSPNGAGYEAFAIGWTPNIITTDGWKLCALYGAVPGGGIGTFNGNIVVQTNG